MLNLLTDRLPYDVNEDGVFVFWMEYDIKVLVIDMNYVYLYNGDLLLGKVPNPDTVEECAQVNVNVITEHLYMCKDALGLLTLGDLLYDKI